MIEPFNVDAEQVALGSMLLSEAAAHTVAQLVGPGDFYRPTHGTLLNAINKVRVEDGAANAVTVAEHLRGIGELERVGGALYLHEIVEKVPTAANGGAAAKIVRDHAVRRRLIDAGLRVSQRGHEIDPEEPHSAIATIVAGAISDLEAVRDFEVGEDLTTQTITEFLAVEDTGYDWIVPGLLERGDRLVLTGQEGLGKSMLLRQLAVSMAAGLHPFTHQPIPPKRVLIVDAENSDTQTRRKLRPMVAQAKLSGYPVDEANLWIEPGVGAMDLAKDRSVSWLMKRVGAIRPDVLVIGPLYKLAPRALQNDDDTAPILAALDVIRDRGVCLLMEAHAGHGQGHGGKRDMRPRGSASLMGWPEFGYGLRLSDNPAVNGGRRAEFVSWRGDRDERDWPEEIESGGRWPWSRALPAGFNPHIVPASGDR